MKGIPLLLLIYLVIGYPASGQDTHSFPPVFHNPVKPGESLDYKVTFGFFTVGKAQIVTADKLYKVNGRACYKMEVRGQTSGAVDWVAKVDDVWGTFMDSLTFLPYMGYRNIKENNYRKNEVTRFDQQKKMVELKTLNQQSGEYNESKIFQTMETVRDVVSGYSYLRTLEYKGKSVGDTIELYGIFEDELYDFKILFAGRESLKTKLGEIKAIKLVPVMPKNQLFAGENSIAIWLSDDINRIPLKIEANLFIGRAACEIVGYANLRNKQLP